MDDRRSSTSCARSPTRSTPSASREPTATPQRLEDIEVMLDQCWDLLRQRRAKREYGDDPDEAHVRSADVVEHYQQ